jgi:CDGSH-type Zn-finger protein/uncharacterized Fe-S cluster protein YjdI
MSDGVRRYEGDGFEVSYDARRCIHAAECVRGLPAVFDTARRPWILPGAADADAVAAVVARCPSGALHVARSDGAPTEQPPGRTLILVTPDGPLFVSGQVRVLAADGATILEDTRVALCRCGQSASKPCCDNSHRAAGFADAGAVPPGGEAAGEGLLTVTASANGPLLLDGPFTLRSLDGEEHTGTKAALCRCGGSGHKPFCDGTHRRVGFRDKETTSG